MGSVPWAALLVALCAGCGGATITRTDGAEIDAEIIASDAYAVHVQDEQGRRGYIPRSHIADIDHPGNVHGGIGTTVTGIGLLTMVSGIALQADCKGDFCFAPLFLITTPGAAVFTTGLPIMIWGWVNYAASTSAAESFAPPPVPGQHDPMQPGGPMQPPAQSGLNWQF